MGNSLVMVLRVISIGILIYLFVLIGLIYNNDVFDFRNILLILGQLRDLISYVIYIILYNIYMGFYYLAGFLIQNMVGFDRATFDSLTINLFQNMVGSWFYFPQLETAGLEYTINNVIDKGLVVLWADISADFFLLILQILLILVFFYAIRSSVTINPSDSIKVVVFINLLIIIPMFFIKLNDILVQFNVSPPQLIQDILALELLKPAIYYQVSNDFLAFLTSEIFLVALFSFIYLEFVFQVSYVDQVTSPSVERDIRLSAQIEILKVEAERAVANIKQMEEAKRQEVEVQKKLESATEADLEDKAKAVSLKTFMAESGKGRFSYISELIEKKKLEREEKKRMGAMKDTRKLANFMDKLFKQEPDAYHTITAKSSAPSSYNLVTSTVTNMVTRIFLITALTWICVHPYYIFKYIFLAPEAIANSVELGTPEGVLSIFIPVLLIIPLTSAIIRSTKHAKLREMLRLEAIQRSGMTEEELEQLHQRSLKKSVEETVFEEDPDAVKASAQKSP